MTTTTFAARASFFAAVRVQLADASAFAAFCKEYDAYFAEVYASNEFVARAYICYCLKLSRKNNRDVTLTDVANFTGVRIDCTLRGVSGWAMPQYLVQWMKTYDDSYELRSERAAERDAAY